VRRLFTFIFSFLSFISIAQIDHWETVVYENDNWDYLVPSSPVNLTWNTVGFNTTGWSVGPGGFGYADGDDVTILPNGTISCFQRIEFSIVDTSTIALAALTIDYDDSFVAYLNGVEITRDLLSAPGQPAWDDLATGLHEAEIYQSIYPSQYSIDKNFIAANLINGLNVLAVQAHNQSNTSSDMTSRVYLHFGISDVSTNYGATPTWFVPPFIFTESNLPIVVINTDLGLSIPNEPKIDAEMGIIYNGEGNINYMTDPFNEFFGDIGIELRGSSSQSFPKKPYGLETRGPDSSNYNASIFNWPADNDWALIAPYSDKSLIRNVLTYKLGNELGRYSPRTKLCEVVLNGEYIGVYVFTERIKQSAGRVNVDKLDFNDTNGNELTGGYIIKKDKTTGGGIVAWTSPFTSTAPSTGPVQFQLHDPKIDTIHPLQLAYIETYVTSFETALDGPNFADPILGYEPYIDVGSFIDFMIMNEISKNVDGYRISTFFHKQHISEGDLLVAGPLWDFNLAWGNANYCQGGLTDGWEIDFNNICGGGGTLDNPFYWSKLVQDPNFTYALNCRWQQLRQDELQEDSLLNYIDKTAIYLAGAANRNFAKWPTLGTYVWPNNFIGNTFQEEIDYLKTWTSARLIWMDANMFGSCPNLGIQEDIINVEIYPNPTENQLYIQLSSAVGELTVIIHDLSGRELFAYDYANTSTANLDLSAYDSGSYLVSIYLNNTIIKNEKIIKF
jgi:CotH kinase protein/Secretion system C-terminal sorting domain